MRIVEHLRVEDGKISTSTFITNSGALMVFVGRDRLIVTSLLLL